MTEVVERQSSYELLRIIAMFFVLVVHSDFLAIGTPTSEDLNNDTMSTLTRVGFESISIISVNLFVLISGWFGIRFSVKGLVKLLFQCLFVYYVVYFAYVLWGGKSITIAGLSYSIVFNWYILSYILLFLFSPILNKYVDTASKKELFTVIFVFYIYQTLYGWFLDAASIQKGYSVVSFIGLYLLSRYIKVYEIKRVNNTRVSFFVFLYVSISVLLSLLTYFLLKTEKDNYVEYMYYYSNPLVVAESVFFFLIFAKLRFYNRFINMIGGSVLVVYLVHMNHYIEIKNHFFSSTIYDLYSTFCGLNVLLYIGLLFIFLFVVSIIIDKIRILFWKLILKMYERNRCANLF